MKKNNQLKEGFTLIELLVTILIIAIISSALLLGTRQNEAKLQLKSAAYQLAQDLAEAREMALGAKQLDCGGGDITREVGLFFDEDVDGSYFLFADCDNVPSKHEYKASDDEIIRTVYLPKEVKICKTAQAIYCFNPPTSPSDLHAVFMPPEPTIYLNNYSTMWCSIKLCLRTDDSIFKKVVVNTVGKIEIQ